MFAAAEIGAIMAVVVLTHCKIGSDSLMQRKIDWHFHKAYCISCDLVLLPDYFECSSADSLRVHCSKVEILLFFVVIFEPV